MKPHLRDNRPVGQRPPCPPVITDYGCDCYECRESGDLIWVERSKRLVPGKYLGREEYYEHRRRRIGTADVLASPAVRPPRDDSSASKPISTDSPAQKETKLPKIRSVEACASIFKLEEVKAEYERRHRLLRSTISRDLVFQFPPTTHSDPGSITTQPQDINSGPFALQFDRAANKDVLAYELWILQAYTIIDSVLAKDRPEVRSLKKSLIRNLERDAERISELKTREWRRRYELARKNGRFLSGEELVVNTAQHLVMPLVAENPVLLTSYIVVVALHILCNLSLVYCEIVVQGLRLLMELTIGDGYANGVGASDIPLDAGRMVESLDLNPQYIGYACCPKCFRCYDINDFPDFCIDQQAKDSPVCGRDLRSGRSPDIQNARKAAKRHASRRYLYHDFKDWMGRFLCRPGIEDQLDRDVFDTGAGHGEYRDIWDGNILKHFNGPDGLLFVRKKEHHEASYVFGLNMDGFNPFTNKHRGPTVSTGAIYMVCMNLPPNLRFRQENIFLVGIIPGPHHPSLVEINHLLRPLMDDLLRFWHDGVYYTATFSYPQGRVVRAALVPVICDLPAARQIMAFASHSSHKFCPYCGQDKDDIDELDTTKWKPGVESREEWVGLAEKWRDGTEKERNALFEETGIRYSELLRLPYWNPTDHVVVDSMHAFFLTELQHHCRVLWGMNVDLAEGKQHKDKKSRRPTELAMAEAWRVMRRGTNEDLEKLALGVIVHLNMDVQLPIGGHRTKLIEQLMVFRRQRGWVDAADIPLNPTPPQQGRNAPVSQEELEHAHLVFSVSTTSRQISRSSVRASVLRAYSGALLTSYAGSLDAEKLKAATTKELLAKELLSWRSTQFPEYRAPSSVDTMYGPPSQDTSQASTITSRSDIKALRPEALGVVLGRDTLHEVHEDIDRMVLPSWIGRIPNNLGSKSCRSLSADQWRTACTVNLVTTLVRLWGPLDADSHQRKMLDNFMDLVTAVKLATRRIIRAEDVENYEFYMHRYLVGVVKLYSDSGNENKLLPYHHISLHIPRFLVNFGPTHSWRCFPFERYNRRLQEIPTNRKFGDIEVTMFNRFCAGQNTRALVLGKIPSPVLERLQPAFRKAFDSDSRGTLLSDIFAFDEDQILFSNLKRMTLLHPATYKLLSQKLQRPGQLLMSSAMHAASQPALVQKSITVRGVKYSVLDTAFGDSQVIFGDFPSGDWFAGRISAMFAWPKVSQSSTFQASEFTAFLELRVLKSLTEEEKKRDYYRMYTDSGRLFSTQYETDAVLIHIDEVVAHFASTVYHTDDGDSGCLHVLPLDR